MIAGAIERGSIRSAVAQEYIMYRNLPVWLNYRWQKIINWSQSKRHLDRIFLWHLILVTVKRE